MNYGIHVVDALRGLIIISTLNIVKAQAKEIIEKYFFKAFLIKLTLSCFFAIDGKLSPCSFVRTIFC